MHNLPTVPTLHNTGNVRMIKMHLFVNLGLHGTISQPRLQMRPKLDGHGMVCSKPTFYFSYEHISPIRIPFERLHAQACSEFKPTSVQRKETKT